MMRVSLSVFGLPVDEYGPLAVAIESMGYDGIWLAEHLIAPVERTSDYPYNHTGDPGFDATTPLADVLLTATHMAALTTRLHVGTGILILPLRDTVSTAKAAATLQLLSLGRLWFGVGSGWLQDEFTLLGRDFGRRGSTMDAQIETLRQLWQGVPVRLEGGRSGVLAPPVEPRIPVITGGTTAPAIRRCADLADGWYGPPCPIADAVRVRTEVARRCEQLGRDVPKEWFVRLTEPYTERSVAEAAAAGFDQVVVSLPGTGAGREAPLDQKLAALERTLATLRL